MRLDLYKDLYLQEEKHWWHISKRKVVALVLSHFLNTNKLKILDIGCGAGKTMDMLSGFGTVWGLDNNQKALSFCKKRDKSRHLRFGEAADTGFQDDFFDLITMLDVLEHTDERDTLAETKRILKRGGIMIISVPAYQWIWSRWDVVLKHKKRYTKHDLEKVVKEYGFSIMLCSYMYSFLVLPAFILRRLKSSNKESYSSDFSTNPPIINFMFTMLANIERYFVVKGWIPFGTSLILVCKK